MSYHNPNCDGAHCTSERGEVRRLPIGGYSGAAVIVCRSCYRAELDHARYLNSLPGAVPFYPQPWELLSTYPAE